MPSLNVPHLRQDKEGWCLPACVAMVAAFWGQPLLQADIAKRFPLFVRHIIRLASDVDVGKPGLSPLLLLLNPRSESDLLHPFAICKHGNIALREAQNAVTWVVVTERANVYSLLWGALSDPAERRTTLTSATTAPRFGFSKVIQERPEFPELRNLLAPVIPGFLMHRIA